MQKILKLQHHKHTGSLLEHQHTSFRGIALLLVVTAAALGVIQKQVSAADTIDVTGKISAVYPTVPAAITSPANNTVVYSNDVAVQGTCQYLPPASIVSISNNGTVVGSTSCTVTGTFTIAILLQPGSNVLVARTSNITDDYGPDSQSITIRYDAPIAPEAQQTNTSTPQSGSQPGGASSNGTGEPVRIIGRSAYIVFGPRKSAEWRGFIEGGTAPFSVTVDWGDGTVETFKNIRSEDLRLTHKYTIMKSQYVQIMARDALGQTTRATYIAVTPFVPRIITTITTPSRKDQTALIIAMASLAAVSLAVALAWYHLRFVQHQAFSVVQSTRRNSPPTKRTGGRHR
jgi:hypothetical protein